MQRKPIHRGAILSAGYDHRRHWLDIEFDTHRLLRYEGVGSEIAERFMSSGSPEGYWREEIEDNYTFREISEKEALQEATVKKGVPDDLKRLFGDM